MRATIRVPKTADRYDDAVEEVKVYLGDMYGGYTVYDGEGGWVNGDGETIEEPVTVIEVFGDIENRGSITQACERVREITGETAVMGSINNSMILV